MLYHMQLFEIHPSLHLLHARPSRERERVASCRQWTQVGAFDERTTRRKPSNKCQKVSYMILLLHTNTHTHTQYCLLRHASSLTLADNLNVSILSKISCPAKCLMVSPVCCQVVVQQVGQKNKVSIRGGNTPTTNHRYMHTLPTYPR